ncbi:MAG UNVERIFIED_CONTAM: hypothetical protein LVQ98_05685 [Rickettsiaceae bacterium]|jgi:hypothetical protein
MSQPKQVTITIDGNDYVVVSFARDVNVFCRATQEPSKGSILDLSIPGIIAKYKTTTIATISSGDLDGATAANVQASPPPTSNNTPNPSNVVFCYKDECLSLLGIPTSYFAMFDSDGEERPLMAGRDSKSLAIWGFYQDHKQDFLNAAIEGYKLINDGDVSVLAYDPSYLT